MNAGKRWPVIPHQAGQETDELDRLLAQWIEQHVFV